MAKLSIAPTVVNGRSLMRTANRRFLFQFERQTMKTLPNELTAVLIGIAQWLQDEMGINALATTKELYTIRIPALHSTVEIQDDQGVFIIRNTDESGIREVFRQPVLQPDPEGSQSSPKTGQSTRKKGKENGKKE
jgi:hypothetical protein